MIRWTHKAGALAMAAGWALSLVMTSTAAAQTPPTPAAPQAKTVAIGPQYAAGGLQRFWFGDGYRHLWTTPVSLQVLDLKTTGGGLSPVRVVGQAQSMGLALRGADGKAYTFRSLHKHPERMLPAVWRKLWPAQIAQDQTSGTHPGAGLIQAALAESSGVAHTQPRLVVMPDDPALGQFRAQFANEVGTIDEFPQAGPNGAPGFMGATEILSSEDMWTRLMTGPEQRIDSRAVLRARILDLWTDNYDRHRGQWRWMRIPGQPLWLPLPEDPDFVLVHHDGVVANAMRGRVPDFLSFSEKFPGRLEGPLNNAYQVDRWVLTDLDRAAWESVAQEAVARLSDAAIDAAVSRLPAEWVRLDAGRTAGALKTRRATLVDYVMRVYGLEADTVNVHATDRDEVVTIARGADDAIDVSLTLSGATTPYYRRRFPANETDEIRVHLHGGNDRVTRSGPAGGPIRIRVVAGGGADVVDDSASGGTDVWRDAGTVEVKRGSGTKVREDVWVNPEPVKGAPWIEPRSFGHFTVAATEFGYSSEPGPIVGYSLTRTAWGFRTRGDSRSSQTVGLRVGTFDQSVQLDYVGRFRQSGSKVSWQVVSSAMRSRRSNFFGFGNDTVNAGDPERYRTRQALVRLIPTVRVEAGRRFEAYLGPEVAFSVARQAGGTALGELRPLGSGTFGNVALRGGLHMDTRKAGVAHAVTDLAASSQFGEVEEQIAGVSLDASAFTSPAVWDVKTAYHGADGVATAYLGTTTAHLALRLGGRKIWGDFPWFDGAFVGSQNNRGYAPHRFTGDASAFGSVSGRIWMGAVPVFVPIRVGLIGFADTGRVWLDGESSTVWHHTVGGGLMARPLATTTMVYAVIGHSKEGHRFYFGFGFPF